MASLLSLFRLRDHSGTDHRRAQPSSQQDVADDMRTIEIVHRTRYEYAEPVTWVNIG